MPLPTPAEIASHIRATRGEFAGLFKTAQILKGAEPALILEFEAVATLPDDVLAFQIALTVAQARDFLKELLGLLESVGFLSGDLLLQLRNAAATGDAPLQAMIDRAAGFLEPGPLLEIIQKASRWTARVLVNGSFEGSGVLIAPHLVLTSWHVVKAFFERNDTDLPVLRATGAPSTLQVEFDNLISISGNSVAAVPLRVEASLTNWFSQATVDEENGAVMTNHADKASCWDYAVLELKKAVGRERRWCLCPPTADFGVPENGKRVILFQYPGGSPLQLDIGTIAPAGASEAQVVPQHRFKYALNALPGSSGGPCFNATGTLVGIHQGKWDNTANRGVPLQAIIASLKSLEGMPLPPPNPALLSIWHLGVDEDYAPIIGCDPFQQRVWSELAPPSTKRILLIDGLPGSGKTFRTRVLRAALQPLEAQHKVLLLSHADLGVLTSRQIATRLLELAGITPVPELVSPDAVNSTGPAWLEAEVLPRLREALDPTRPGPTLWLVLTDLNRVKITNNAPQEFLSDFLFKIYELAALEPRLRIVLDGMQALLSERARPAAVVDTAVAPAQADVITFYERFLALLGRTMDIGFTDFAESEFQELESLRTNGADTALLRFAERTQKKLERLTAKDKQKTLAELYESEEQ